MSDINAWINALRGSHERFRSTLARLDDAGVEGPSYDDGWSIAQVASHLGSQAEIFGLFLGAGLNGEAAPGGEQFAAIWERWDGLAPRMQVTESLAANEAFVSRLEQLPDAERAAFRISLFGSHIDLSGLAALRLGEHALHTWDIVVAVDPSAVLSADAVDLLIDTLPTTAARAGKATEDALVVDIETTSPERSLVLSTAPSITLSVGDPGGDEALRLPAESLIRLVSGRLDPEHTPPSVTDDAALNDLRAVFPGY